MLADVLMAAIEVALWLGLVQSFIRQVLWVKEKRKVSSGRPASEGMRDWCDNANGASPTFTVVVSPGRIMSIDSGIAACLSTETRLDKACPHLRCGTFQYPGKEDWG